MFATPDRQGRGPQVQHLISAARRGQWSADADIDWSLPVAVPFWLSRRTYRRIVSQIYHGEIATQQLCRRLLGEVGDGEARVLLGLQLGDEVRHAAAYRRYLETIGGIAPAESALSRALQRSLDWRGSPAALIAAFHIVFEGGALAILQHLAHRFPCPQLAAINAKVAPDEARHFAFGRAYLSKHAPALTAEEREAIYAWLETVWREAAGAARRRHTVMGALATRMGSGWLADGWMRQADVLAELGFGGADKMPAD